MSENNNIRIFESEDGKVQLEVSLDQETVWLSQRQLAELFGKDVRTVNEHIKYIYLEQELKSDATIRKFRIVQQEGRREVSREVEHYNLDVVISVGYRVKSQRGVQFRQWATLVLKQHLVEGYALNEKRLQERGIEFDRAIALLSNTLSNQQLVTPEGESVVRVISDYARSWSLLQAYDEQSLTENANKQQGMRALDLTDVLAAVNALKHELIAKGEATELFAQLRSDGLESAIANIEQSFGGEYLYPNIARRAAHLLYFVIKNHPLACRRQQTDWLIFIPMVFAAESTFVGQAG